MELFRTSQFYIFSKGEHSLWLDRFTGEFIPKTAWSLAEADDPVCLGICQGIIGKVSASVFSPRIMVIKESVPVGKIHGGSVVYKIKSIAFVPASPEDIEINLPKCTKHKSIALKQPGIFDLPKTGVLGKTLGTIKNAKNTIKNSTQQAAAIATSGLPKRKNEKDKERFEKQIMDEFYKIFNDTNSFYYSHTTDLTNSRQRLCNMEKNGVLDVECLWKIADDKFFWNKHMVKNFIESENKLFNPWILPIIQGYVQVEDCRVDTGQYFQIGILPEQCIEVFKLCILSRRSRYRAGTRYKRRGVDEKGHCANYVETEQLIIFQNHELSFVQVRGSVPVFWSQVGFKYRPPPKMDKGESENCAAFEQHFNNEIHTYGPICAVNLVDQTGSEKVIFDAYSNYVYLYNSPFITYVTFDFHEYCRGMHFENVSILINAIAEIIKDMNYCWKDDHGHICSQKGVFRVNCVDCLDRTNVVQTAIGKAVMEIQFCKLGLTVPETPMPENIKKIFQNLWANNGDIISKQYAGTNALKGDYTRTGERKFTGIMKDGVNSANRYYLSRFKDATRQGTIDLMLGNYVNEENFYDSKTTQNDDDHASMAEHIKSLLDDCKKMLVKDPESVLGIWGLINADLVAGDSSETEMDSVVILTKDSYFVADYDDQVDKITKYQEVYLRDVVSIECGMGEIGKSLFSSSRMKSCIRINYKMHNSDGYYHMFRSASLGFFNNMPVVFKTSEEELESLKAVCEAFLVATEIGNLPAIPFSHGHSLERRKSKLIDNSLSGNMYLDIFGIPQITRNVSESQLHNIKNVGSKAISNMTQQFFKLNKIGNKLKPQRPKQLDLSTTNPNGNDESTSSDDDVDCSIFQPDEEQGRCPIFTLNTSSSECKSSIECGEEALELNKTLRDKNDADSFLPGVGIVMGGSFVEHNLDLDEKFNLLADVGASNVNNIQLTSIMQNVNIPKPEILINFDGDDKKKTSSDKTLSNSYSEAEKPQDYVSLEKRSNSEYEVNLNISQSLSESALKNKITSITSPVSQAFSPFSKLAKGVQNLGANLDKKLSGQMRQVLEKDMEEHRKLKEKWSNCKSRLVAL